MPFPLMDAAGGAAVAGVSLFFIVVIGLIVLASVFWIWMLVDAATSSLPSTEKLVWVIVILFGHILGALIYFVAGRAGARGRMTQ